MTLALAAALGVGAWGGQGVSLGGGQAWALEGDDDPKPMPAAQETGRSPSVLDARHSPALVNDDQPFYRSTAFWIVTGVLVGAAIGLGVYAANHDSPTNLAGCPSGANLGCFGAGR